ncbi:MAG: esterase-like activity of phytase family protein [Planctomycetota bacterium]
MTPRPLIVSLLALAACAGAPAQDPARDGPRVRHVELELPEGSAVPAQGPAAEAFPQGFPVSLGSGLCYAGRDGEAILLWAISDRGPNGDGPEFAREGQDPAPTKLFGAPDFTPVVAKLRLEGERATVLEWHAIRGADGAPLSGLPRPAGPGSTGEVALGEDLNTFPAQASGIDPEGIDVDAEGNLWICEEYGPDVLQLDPSGKVLRHLRPGAELPEDVSRRLPNRGFEAVCVTPAGKVIAGVQSVCYDSEGKRKAAFIRLVELDPSTGATRTFAYLHDADAYKRPRDAKLGDLCALNDDELLLIEQGKVKGGDRNVIYRVDLRGATDLSGRTREDGSALEGASLEELEAAGIVPVKKELVVDLRALGWSVEKAEGLAIVDATTLVVIADHDFGLTTTLLDPQEGHEEADDYTVVEGALTLDGKPAPETRLRMLPSGETTELWVVELPQPLPLKR